MNPKKKVVFNFDAATGLKDAANIDWPRLAEEMNHSQQLMERIGKHRPDRPEPDWVSRDYALVVPCARTACPVNREEHCSMPSAIKIGPSGLCLTGQGLIQNPPVKSGPAVCRWCGGRIRKQDGRWEHVEEKLSHIAEPR